MIYILSFSDVIEKKSTMKKCPKLLKRITKVLEYSGVEEDSGEVWRFTK